MLCWLMYGVIRWMLTYGGCLCRTLYDKLMALRTGFLLEERIRYIYYKCKLF